MSQPFYITTPIYYVNDVPHLGHAYTTIVADAIARFHRMRGDDTWFLTGTDEHGQKVEEAATKRGLTAQELCDQVAPRFAETWKTLDITNDDFIRTTEPRHKAIVTELWKRISSNGDLYLETYQGWYCVGCEAFYKESDLEKVADGYICATHKKPVSWIDKERSWFFRLSKFAEPLLAHIEQHPEFIQPEQYRNEIVAFIRGGLRDLSVSRTSFTWGIPAPEPDPTGEKHVIYVWLDALTNYYSALAEPGELGGPRVEKLWSTAIHLIGKDILRFHAVYWPAFLLSARLPLPRTILTHGWWTVRGVKISKSMPATRIDPLKLAETLGETTAFGFPIGNDAMRYYLLREVPLGNDGDFTFESLLGRYNAELANDLGNLINRSLTMITKFGGDTPPARDDAFHADGTENPHWQLEVHALEAVKLAATQFDLCMPSRALEQIWLFVGKANRYIDQTQPWTMAKTKNPALAHTLWSLQSSLWLIARLVAPVLPATSKLLRGWLGEDVDTLPMWPVPDDTGRVLVTAMPLRPTMPASPLFPRLDDAQQAAIIEKLIPPELLATASAPAPAPAAARAKPAKPAKEPEAPPGPIEYADFAKLELRSGKVLAAAAVPKSAKLVQLTVDLGEPAPRTILAGIAERYAPADLVGRQVIVVANLAPRKMAGVVSQGMILAAGDEAILGLSALDQDVPPGTRVR